MLAEGYREVFFPPDLFFAESSHRLCAGFSTEGSVWQVAAQLNTLLSNENERLRQLIGDLEQRHSHMTSEVSVMSGYLRDRGVGRLS